MATTKGCAAWACTWALKTPRLCSLQPVQPLATSDRTLEQFEGLNQEKAELLSI